MMHPRTLYPIMIGAALLLGMSQAYAQPALPPLPGAGNDMALPPALPGALPLPGDPMPSPVPPAPTPMAPAMGNGLTPPPLPVMPGTAAVKPALPPTGQVPGADPRVSGALPVLPQGVNGPATPPGVVLAPVVEEKTYSYGKSNVTLLFLPTQIDRMKEAIQFYENSVRDKPVTPTFVGAEPVTAPKELIKEPNPYPVFNLSSIVYRTPGDWSVWVAGYKITPHKNDTDVNVVSVNKEQVTFSWTPTFEDALRRRVAEKLFASTDPVKNKLSKAQNVRFDEETGSVIFSLNQNQSFAVGYFATFEGYVDSPKLDPLQVDSVAINNEMAAPMKGMMGAPVSAASKPPAMGAPGPKLPSTPTFTMQPVKKAP